MRTKIWENLQYIVLALTIVGQCVMNIGAIYGQSAFLIANLITVTRDFKLGRPVADKVKNIALTAITIGLVLLLLFKK